MEFIRSIHVVVVPAWSDCRFDKITGLDDAAISLGFHIEDAGQVLMNGSPLRRYTEKQFPSWLGDASKLCDRTVLPLEHIAQGTAVAHDNIERICVEGGFEITHVAFNPGLDVISKTMFSCMLLIKSELAWRDIGNDDLAGGLGELLSKPACTCTHFQNAIRWVT
jgi:hypothetical protein